MAIQRRCRGATVERCLDSNSCNSYIHRTFTAFQDLSRGVGELAVFVSFGCFLNVNVVLFSCLYAEIQSRGNLRCRQAASHSLRISCFRLEENSTRGSTTFFGGLNPRSASEMQPRVTRMGDRSEPFGGHSSIQHLTMSSVDPVLLSQGPIGIQAV